MIPQLDKFPRSRRFTLGERIETGLLAVLEALIAAAYSREKRVWLDRANRQINVVRHLWRLAVEARPNTLERIPPQAGRSVEDPGRILTIPFRRLGVRSVKTVTVRGEPNKPFGHGVTKKQRLFVGIFL